MQKSIAHIVHSLEVGGLERVVADLVCRLDPARYRPVVYCLESAGAFKNQVESVARVNVLNKKPGRSMSLAFALSRLMRRDRVDLVHAHNHGPLVYGAVAARIVGCRSVVYTLHGPEAAEQGRYGFLSRAGMLSRVVGVSEYVRGLAVRTGGVEEAKTAVVYNGIDTARFAAADGARSAIRAELGVPDGSPAIGVIARLTQEKAHDVLLQAFALFLQRRENARLILVGDGPLRTSLETLARSLAIGRSVAFLGTRDDVPEILSALDLFVLPSRIEGLGLTLIEAMAAGLPTISTSTGGMPEITTGDTGLTVPPDDPAPLADAMARLVDDPDRAKEMGIAARERATTHFDVASMVDGYERIYEELLGRG